MPLPSRTDLKELVGAWSKSTSLLQFFFKDAWEIPIVRSLIAPLGVGASVTTGSLPEAAPGYTTALVLGAVAYFVVWARLNLKAMLVSAVEQSDEQSLADENRNDEVKTRKLDLCRFVNEDFAPASNNLAEVAEQIFDLVYPNKHDKEYAMVNFRRMYIGRHRDEQDIKRFNDSAYMYNFFRSMQNHVYNMLYIYGQRAIGLTQLITERNLMSNANT